MFKQVMFQLMNVLPDFDDTYLCTICNGGCYINNYMFYVLEMHI